MSAAEVRRQEEARSDAQLYSDLKGGGVLVFINGGPEYVICSLGDFNMKGVKNISVLDDDDSDWAFTLDPGAQALQTSKARVKSAKASPIKAVRTLLRSNDGQGTETKVEGSLTKAFKGIKLVLSSPGRGASKGRTLSEEPSSKDQDKLR